MDNTLKQQIGRLIDKYEGETLWLEAVKLAIKTNPTIAKEALLVIRDVKDERSALIDPVFGVSQDKSMRAGLRMPVSLDNILEVVDPENFPINQHEPKHQQKILNKLVKTFPEFALAQKF